MFDFWLFRSIFEEIAETRSCQDDGFIPLFSKYVITFHFLFSVYGGVGWVQLHHVFNFRYTFIDFFFILSLRDKRRSIILLARVMMARARKCGFDAEKQTYQRWRPFLFKSNKNILCHFFQFWIYLILFVDVYVWVCVCVRFLSKHYLWEPFSLFIWKIKATLKDGIDRYQVKQKPQRTLYYCFNS